MHILVPVNRLVRNASLAELCLNRGLILAYNFRLTDVFTTNTIKLNANV